MRGFHAWVVLAVLAALAPACAPGDDHDSDSSGGAPPGGGGGPPPGGNSPPAWSGLPASFTFATGAPSSRSFASQVSDPDGDPLTITAVGAWPAGVNVDSAARTIVYDGIGPAAQVPGLRLQADDGRGGITASSAFTISISTPSASAPTVTTNVARESNAGHDGAGIYWQSVFLLKDGRIASFGTGNHAPEQSNAVRCIDPVRSPPGVQYSELFPWTQDISPPDMWTGRNLYVSNYDNHASIYIPSDNKLVWVGHGVFDVATRQWTHGDRPPFGAGQRWDGFVDTGASPGFAGVYNPAVGWSEILDKGVWFGNSAGGSGAAFNDLTLLERNPNYPATSTRPWRLSVTNLGSQGVAGLTRSRNSAVCVGTDLYVTGPEEATSTLRFYRINLQTRRLVATLAPPPAVSGEYFPQLVHDTARNRFVLIGQRVFLYDLAGNSWSNVTPAGWPGYSGPCGVYHPALDCIFFRGTPPNATGSEGFLWHKMVFP